MMTKNINTNNSVVAISESPPLPGRRCKFTIFALTGADDAFLPVRGFTSIPPGDRRDFGPKSFLAPVMYL
jgi:hypothetical protein